MSPYQLHKLGLAATVALLVSTHLPALAGGWRFTDLGTDGLNSSAYAINNNGEVIGSEEDATTHRREPFIFSGGQKRRLPSLGGSSTVVMGINNFGEVVGWAYPPGDGAYHAFIYRNGVTTDLGTLGGVASQAHKINDLGQIVGTVQMPNGNEQLFSYSAGAFSFPEGFMGKQIVTIRLNNKGQIAANVLSPDPQPHSYTPFIYSKGTLTILSQFRSMGYVAGLNDQGILTAYRQMFMNGTVDDILYDVNTHQLIGRKDSIAGFGRLVDANNKGQVIAYIGDSMGSSMSPYFYDIRTDVVTKAYEVPRPPGLIWSIKFLSGINDRGQMVGYATNRYSGGLTRAFVLSPIPD